MEKSHLIRNLLKKYLQGNLTPQEQDQFYDFLADNSNEQLFKEVMYGYVHEFTEVKSADDRHAEYDKMYVDIISQLKIEQSSSPKHPVRKLLLYISSAAAVLTAAFLLGRAFPAVQADTNINFMTAYTEVKSPYGSRSEVKLPDGTSVILNAGSTIRYGNDYNLSNRDIGLNGEAYFKVARNTEIPLVVSAGEIEVTAIGTEFNVKAYPEESTIETTLIEGKVEITHSSQERQDEEFIDLIPNQKAIFYKEEERYRLEKIENDIIRPEPVKPFLDKVLISPKTDVEKTVAWTEGRLIFRSENLENLCIDLQRKYDVKFFFIEEELKKYRFTGVLLDETLEQVLDVIKMAAPIDFSIEGKTVYLFTDVKQLDGYREHSK